MLVDSTHREVTSMRSDPQTSHQAPDRVSDAELLVGAILVGVIILLTSTLVPLFA